jgi:four helix bundle protein
MKDNESPDLIERTRAFALRVIRLSASLPRSKEATVLGKQILRSGTSVGANYREAQRARSKAEFVAKVGDSLKELDETLCWLELILGSELVKPRRLQPLVDECNELLAIFTAIHKRAKGV